MVTKRSYKLQGLPFTVLEEFWNRYFDGTNNSLRELVEGLPLTLSTGSSILRRGGEPPHHKYARRKHYDNMVVNAALTAPSDLSIPDCAHFTGIPVFVLRGKPGFQKAPYGGFRLPKKLSYRMIDSHFEALDAGFSNPEAVEFSGIPLKYETYCLNNRKIIEQEVADFMENLNCVALVTTA